MSIYYRMYWCWYLRGCFRPWSIALSSRFLGLLRVERLLIIHYRLIVSCHYYSFVVNSLSLTFLLLSSVNRKYVFQSKSFVWISIAWSFQSVTFLMQFIKRNFWWHTCLSHFLRIDLIARYVVHHYANSQLFWILIQFIWELIDFMSFDVVKLPE